MSTDPPTNDRRKRLPWSVRLYRTGILFLQILAVLGALNLAGVPAAVHEAVIAASGGDAQTASDHDDCEPACPRGCTTCHPPADVGRSIPSVTPRPRTQSFTRPTASRAPVAPFLDTVFRPPRRAIVS